MDDGRSDTSDPQDHETGAPDGAEAGNALQPVQESVIARSRIRMLGDQLESASAEAGAYTSLLDDMRAQVQELQRATELRYHLADRIQDLEAVLDAREASLAEANAMVLEVESAYRDLQIQATSLRQNSEEAHLKHSSALERISFLERALERVEREFDEQRAANADLRAESMNARGEASAAMVRMESLQRRHDELRTEYSRQQIELESNRREFERQVTTLRSLYEAVQMKLATLESVRNHLAGQNDTLRRENIRMKQAAENQESAGKIEAEKWRLYAQSLESILSENGISVRSQSREELLKTDQVHKLR